MITREKFLEWDNLPISQLPVKFWSVGDSTTGFTCLDNVEEMEFFEVMDVTPEKFFVHAEFVDHILYGLESPVFLAEWSFENLFDHYPTDEEIDQVVDIYNQRAAQI